MNYSINMGLFALTLGLLACSRSLPAENEEIDLGSAGLPVTITGPKGGVLEKDSNGVTVRWGERGSQGRLGFSRGISTLGCTALDDECKILEQTDRSVIKQKKLFKKTLTEGMVNVRLDAASFQCNVTAADVSQIKRLIAACESAKATGPLGTTTTTSAVGGPAKAKAPDPADVPELEPLSFVDKTKRGELKYSLKVPKGFSDQPNKLNGGHTFSDSGSKLNAMTINVVPLPTIKTLDAAENEVKRADIVKLDTIATKTELGKGRYLLKTAPRGALKLVTVHVFASGKNGTMWARCHGRSPQQAVLEEICTSLDVQ